MNEEILKLADLSGVKVGDTIWTINEGEVKVISIELKDAFPIKIDNLTYTLEGKCHFYDKYPSAFIRNPFENIGFQERWMMVSHNGYDWVKRKVVAKYNSRFVAIGGATTDEEANKGTSVTSWDHAKEIEKPKDIELTLEQIAEKFGVSVESIKIKK